MDKNKLIIYILVTIVVTTIFVWLICSSFNNSIKEEIALQNKIISELKQQLEENKQNYDIKIDSYSNLEENLYNIQNKLDDIVGYVDAMYDKMFPDAEKYEIQIID